jgi:hypothetical protein
MNALIEKPSQVESAFDVLPKALKIIGILGSICGFFYLLAYTRDIGIPFPLELSVLPTMLLLVGVTSVGGTALLVGGILIPGLMADDPLEVTKAYFLAREVKSNVGIARIRRYLLCSWIPMATALFALILWLGIVAKSAWVTPTAVALLGLSLSWILLTPTRVQAFKGKWLQYAITMLVQTLLSVWAYCLAILVFIAAYPEIETWPAWQACLLVLAVFTVIHIVITAPHDKGKGRKILLPPYYEYEAVPAAAVTFFVASLLTALSVFMYPLNAKVGRTVLRAFGIGGGMPVMICLKNKPPAQVTQRVGFGVDDCSEPLLMLFDGGDRVYVAKSIPGQKRDTKTTAPTYEPVYFRQDEIREKIYLPLPAKKQDSQTAS